jgi:hypothetical protein
MRDCNGIHHRGYARKVYFEDFGIIVRAPHPEHPSQFVLILAGAHSLGSGAACIAATSSKLIEQIRGKLGDDRDALADKQQALWVLLKGKASPDGTLREEDIEILRAGV